eukprot:TRINITY_DN16945_c0_g1_i1.p1 TRINITY_DN16945_c0_g1~~TRINITY_DN16945_c0_g1_i1.p1  ORF type:complete len:569 (-),score=128.44 TRINITY_DN16945_c0_g1_i1:232-1938(-)
MQQFEFEKQSALGLSPNKKEQRSPRKKAAEVAKEKRRTGPSLKERVAARELSAESAIAMLQSVMQKISETFAEGPDIDLKAAFEEFDQDGGGTIDQAELKAALVNLGIVLSDAELQLIMRHFDKDGRGIEYGEFAWTYYNRRTLGKAGGGGMQKREAVGKSVKSASWMIDHGEAGEDEDPMEKVQYQNHSKTVSGDPGAAIFKQVMDMIQEASQPQPSDAKDLRSMFKTTPLVQRLKAVFTKYDIDGSGELDQNEFAGMVRDMGVSVPQEDLRAAFKYLDRDGGGVEWGELQWAFNNRNDIAAGKQRWCAAKDQNLVNHKLSSVQKTQKRITSMIERDPTYVVRVTPSKFERTYADSPMGVFECSMDKIRDKAISKNGKVLDLKKVFDQFDIAGRGLLDRNRFRHGLADLGVVLSEQEFEILYATLDRDGGGIEYGEFCWCFYNRRVLASGNAPWCDPSGAGQVVAKQQKPRLGDAGFRYYLEQDMRKLVQHQKKAERIERDRRMLRQQTRDKLEFHQRTSASSQSCSQADWVPAGRLKYDDLFLTNREPRLSQHSDAGSRDMQPWLY